MPYRCVNLVIIGALGTPRLSSSIISGNGIRSSYGNATPNASAAATSSATAAAIAMSMASAAATASATASAVTMAPRVVSTVVHVFVVVACSHTRSAGS